jgi:outer membrane protein assembly factor BamB
VGHYENEFLCFDLEKGERLWSYHDRNFPYFSSPAVGRDRVLFGGRDRRLHCVGRDDGKALWTFPTGGKVDSSPVIVGDRVVFGSADGRLYLVDLEEGDEVWSTTIGDAITASPAVVQGHVVIGSEDGALYCFGTKANSQ